MLWHSQNFFSLFRSKYVNFVYETYSRASLIMKSEFCNVTINAPTKKEAELIRDELLEEKLVAGANIFQRNCKYWWEGKLDSTDYWFVEAETVIAHKIAIIKLAKELHSDDCPGVVFTPIDANKAFLRWIKENIR